MNIVLISLVLIVLLIAYFLYGYLYDLLKYLHVSARVGSTNSMLSALISLCNLAMSQHLIESEESTRNLDLAASLIGLQSKIWEIKPGYYTSSFHYPKIITYLDSIDSLIDDFKYVYVTMPARNRSALKTELQTFDFTDYMEDTSKLLKDIDALYVQSPVSFGAP